MYKKFWPQDHAARKMVVIDSQIHQPQLTPENSVKMSPKSINSHISTQRSTPNPPNTSTPLETEIKEVHIISTLNPNTASSREIQIPVSYVSRSSSCNSLSSSGGSMNEYDVEQASSKALPSTPVDQSSVKGIRKITIKANCSVLDEPFNELDSSAEHDTSSFKLKDPEDETIKVYVLLSIKMHGVHKLLGPSECHANKKLQEEEFFMSIFHVVK